MRLIYGLIHTVLILSLLIWPLGLFGMMFMFDAPGSEKNLILIGLVLSILVYPIPILKGSINFWKNRKECTAINCKKYTLISLIGPVNILFFSSLLEIFCGGNFACH